MVQDIHEPRFWDDNADYRKIVHDFTEFYSRRAWDLEG